MNGKNKKSFWKKEELPQNSVIMNNNNVTFNQNNDENDHKNAINDENDQFNNNASISVTIPNYNSKIVKVVSDEKVTWCVDDGGRLYLRFVFLIIIIITITIIITIIIIIIIDF